MCLCICFSARDRLTTLLGINSFHSLTNTNVISHSSLIVVLSYKPGYTIKGESSGIPISTRDQGVSQNRFTLTTSTRYTVGHDVSWQ
jgi:hypothetical protein